MSVITTSIYDCYEYIIGLSHTEGDCHDPKTGFLLDYNTSYSGLYLDDLLPLSRVESLEKNVENVWYILNQCRDRGIKRFVSDAQAALMANYQLRNQPYNGIIGRIKHTKDRTLNATYAGVQFYCKDYRGAMLTINNIGTIMNYTGVVDVTVYDNIGNNYGPYTLNCVTDTLTLNTITPLELPLHNDYVENIRYYFMYKLAGNAPRNNDLHCNCGSVRPVFNPNRPYFTKSFGGRFNWANYVMIGGCETDELDFDENDYGACNYMNGLIFDVELRCHISKMLCDEDLDYEGDPTAMAIAFAVLYASGIDAIEKIFSDPRLNLTKIKDKEYLAVRQKEFEALYKEKITYIADTIDIRKTDCILCRNTGPTPHRKPLLV